jgi:hypothetical protein
MCLRAGGRGGGETRRRLTWVRSSTFSLTLPRFVSCGAGPCPPASGVHLSTETAIGCSSPRWLPQNRAKREPNAGDLVVVDVVLGVGDDALGLDALDCRLHLLRRARRAASVEGPRQPIRGPRGLPIQGTHHGVAQERVLAWADATPKSAGREAGAGGSGAQKVQRRATIHT